MKIAELEVLADLGPTPPPPRSPSSTSSPRTPARTRPRQRLEVLADLGPTRRRGDRQRVLRRGLRRVRASAHRQSLVRRGQVAIARGGVEPARVPGATAPRKPALVANRLADGIYTRSCTRPARRDPTIHLRPRC